MTYKWLSLLESVWNKNDLKEMDTYNRKKASEYFKIATDRMNLLSVPDFEGKAN